MDWHKPPICCLILALFLASCGVPGLTQSCAEQSKEFLDQIQPIAREWDDAAKLANQTPRMGLSVQIANLQAIRRKVQDMKPPECAKQVQEKLTESMDATIQGYLDFMTQKPDATVQASFKKANDAMLAFGTAMLQVRTGVSLTPTP